MRVLQIGFGVIGSEIWTDYKTALLSDYYAVVDKHKDSPHGYVWDGEPVDVGVVVVDTPSNGAGGFDYRDLDRALAEYEHVCEYFVVRSTVGLDFLDTRWGSRVGLSPEFYGATKWSRRGVLNMGFDLFSEDVPQEFIRRVSDNPILGTRQEVVLAKLAENAYLATKVTFFHELALACAELGADFDVVRTMVTSDTRIGPAHTYMEDPGWASHCFDKDVPAYAATVSSELVRAAIEINTRKLLPARRTD